MPPLNALFDGDMSGARNRWSVYYAGVKTPSDGVRGGQVGSPLSDTAG